MESSQDERLERRRQAFVDAARSLFIERGFEGTSLADVVERAGGSLATLYKLFGNKAGLLAAVVMEKANTSDSLIAEMAESDLDPAACLNRLADNLAARLLDPERMAISRIVIAYSIEDAEFASEFYQMTLLPYQRALTTVFERWRDRGEPLQGEPAVLAEIFLGMFIYEVHSEVISHGAISRHGVEALKDKIDFFCRGAGLSC